MTSIVCKDLCKTFQQGDEIITGLDNVSITIDKGDFVCLSGPSGSGKTTLLNAIGGLDTPDSGQIFIGDIQIDKLAKGPLADMRLNNIGFVFQAYNLIPVLTARENVEFVMQVSGMSAEERSRRSHKILKEVGLEGMEDRRPAHLSGGQQQRVAVARAIVSQPTLILADEPTANLDSVLILADEPTANLDSVTSSQLMDLFVELNQNHHITFVIATHDVRVMKYAKRLIRMEDGKIISDDMQLQTQPQVLTSD